MSHISHNKERITTINKLITSASLALAIAGSATVFTPTPAQAGGKQKINYDVLKQNPGPGFPGLAAQPRHRCP